VVVTSKLVYLLSRVDNAITFMPGVCVFSVLNWFVQFVNELGDSEIDFLSLTLILEWHTHACRLGVNVNAPSVHYLIPSCYEYSTLNSNN
jgi:hypothetical protein